MLSAPAIIPAITPADSALRPVLCAVWSRVTGALRQPLQRNQPA